MDDSKGMDSKMIDKNILKARNKYFTICSDAALSIKDGKCAFSFAIFYKGAFVYAGLLKETLVLLVRK